MSLNFIEKAKGILIHPGEAFRQSHEDELSDAIRYFAVILTIFAILWGFITTVATGVAEGTGVFILFFIGGFIALFIGGVALQISSTFVAGEKKNFDQALKVLLYSSTPAMLFGWIPIIGIIGGLWSLALMVSGIREVYGISTARSAVAVVLTLINTSVVSMILIVVLAIFIGANGAGVSDYLITAIFLTAVLALFNGGAYVICKSMKSSPADPHLRGSSVHVPPGSGRQKHPKEEGLFIDQISTVFSQTNRTQEKIEADLRRMKTAHPAWMERPEFAPLVEAVEMDLKDPAKLPEVTAAYDKLKKMTAGLEQDLRDLDRLQK